MQLSKSQISKLIIAILLTVGAVVMLFLLSQFNHGLGAPQPNEALQDEHTADGGSQLKISDEGQLKEKLGSSIANSVATQLYAAHYQKSSKLERQAELVDLKDKGRKSKTITIKFLPSGDNMTAQVIINNSATNDFDIQIEGAK
jgi:hypothetical protein